MPNWRRWSVTNCVSSSVKPPRIKPRSEMHERDLRGVAFGREHALAEERAVERNAVEAADNSIAVPHLDGVAGAEVEQVAVERADARVDPGRHAAGARCRTAIDHAIVVIVDFDL